MTITLDIENGSSQPFIGPGHFFTAKAQFANDPTHDYSFVMQVKRGPTLATVCHVELPHYIQGNNWDGAWGIKRVGTEIIPLAVGGGIFGDTAAIHAQVIDATLGTIVDDLLTDLSYGYDPYCQLYNVILASAGSGSGGGFNQGDRDQLTAVHNATVRSAYTTTATHVGLVDNGSITTLNLTRALRVTVITFPPNVDRDLGTPEYFFNLGFVTLNASQGWVRSARLVFEFQLYEAPQSLDSFGWTLSPGTTINVEELAPT